MSARASEPPTPRIAPGTTVERRYEAHVAVAVLCSELAHEVAPTLAFLRDLVRSKVLAADDLAIAQEEVARLEWVMASLRRTRRSEETTEMIDLETSVGCAVASACADVRVTGEIAVDVPSGLLVTASVRGLDLMLVTLLRNALLAAAGAPVALRARFEEDAWGLEVEDAGPGLPDALVDSLFQPLSTLSASGCGTGIPTALRVARDHGWQIAHARRGDRTVFTVQFNPDDTSFASPS